MRATVGRCARCRCRRRGLCPTGHHLAADFAGSGSSSSWATVCPPRRQTPGWHPMPSLWAMWTCMSGWVRPCPISGSRCLLAHPGGGRLARNFLWRQERSCMVWTCSLCTEALQDQENRQSSRHAAVLCHARSPDPSCISRPPPPHPACTDLHLVWLRAARRPEPRQGEKGCGGAAA